MRAVKILLACALFAAAATAPGCSCANGGRNHGGDAGAPGTITIDPTDVTLDLTSGGTPQTATFKVTYHGPQTDTDVTATTTFTLADPTLGSMNGSTFTTGMDHGGSTVLTAIYAAPAGATSAFANIHVRVHGSFTDPSCSGCPMFPDDNATPCAAAAAPQIVYPPDGVLLPPNLNQIEVHYQQGVGDVFFELDYENPATDVRVLAKCTPVADTRGTAVPNGCVFKLDQATWDFIAKSNKGGDPIVITIRATTDGTCASPSNTTRMSIAEEDMQGTLYYWKSTVTAAGTGGEIWRKSFGDANPEELISPMSGSGFSATCYGCHFLSRDGLRMTISADDSDSDDEYTDVSMGLVDVATKQFITMISYAQGQASGFQTFSNDHSLYLGSVGDGTGSRTAGSFSTTPTNTNQFFIWNGQTGADASPPSVTVGPALSRPTMPDWSVDNKQVVYVMPNRVGWNDGFEQRLDDTHVYGGSLWSLPYTGGVFGQPVELIHSNGDNNYYPTISPDGSFIAYDHVDQQTTSNGQIDGCMTTVSGPGTCPNDSFSNPKARVWMIPAAGTGGNPPIDLELANGSPAASPTDVSNSWPRWSPFLQKYRSQKLLWITFSSTRDYGLRVRNHVMVGGQAQVQCYPPDSAEWPNGSHGDQFGNNCQQPQVWMAAVNLSVTETGSAADPSFPAFWLPFQDIKTHNHSAQWTTLAAPPTGDCTMGGVTDPPCSQLPCCAGAGVCLADGHCGVP
jgi:hypothetical protein